tara:strand:+ start:159 stop:899 length:741 start_codon:yes stop_codon:yes gene_type:complete
MALPVLNAPTHELTLTSSGEKIQFRPFLVKEEKLLLMALESNNDDEMMRAMKQLIKNCVLSDIDIETIPLFDIQYIFLQIRCQSVGEEITLRFKHPDDKNEKGETCTHIQDVIINLMNIKPEAREGHTKKIDLSSDVGVVMTYPNIDMMKSFADTEGNTEVALELIFDIIIKNIEMIYQGDEVFYAEEHTKEEMQDFLNSLNPTQFNKIRDFFQTMPYLRHEFEYVCDKCGCKENINLAGVEDFFA